MTFEYDLLGRLIEQTDFNGKTTTYEYDHMDRVVRTTDGVGDVTVAYSSDGQLATVTDGLDHTWTYAYDSALRLSTITDPINKVVKYFYDSAGRLSKVGAGSDGSFDPTEYFYSSTTGLMSKVRYWSGANSYDADYHYDGLARVPLRQAQGRLR
jgi:YD repeat-containing protein